MIGVAVAGVKHPPSPAGKLKVPADTDHQLSSLSKLGSDRKNAISVEDYPDSLLFDTKPVVIDLDKYIEVDDDDDDVVIFVKCEKASPVSGRKRAARSIHLDEPVTELGESSDPKCFCAICMEPKPFSEAFSMSGCPHTFCQDCTRQYLAVKIHENAGHIVCPHPGCKDGVLEPERCHAILPPEVFERWCRVLCESLILASAQFFCPFKECSAPLLMESGSVITQSECPHCFRLFCVQCKVPWHAQVSCEEYQKLGKDERAREDIMLMTLAKAQKWQRCPKCRFYVDKIEGCKAMKCRCGHAFCYTCGTEMVQDHYCSKCRC